MDTTFLKWFAIGTTVTVLMAVAIVKAGQKWG